MAQRDLETRYVLSGYYSHDSTDYALFPSLIIGKEKERIRKSVIHLLSRVIARQDITLVFPLFTGMMIENETGLVAHFICSSR